MHKPNQQLKKIQKREKRYLKKYKKKKDPWIEQQFSQKVPEKLQSTLESAFIKAFHLIFTKGVSWIEKTYDRQSFIQHTTWKQNHKKTKHIAKRHTLIAGVSGMGLGLLGIGLPDIFIYTALLFRNVYQIALQNGFSYTKPEEQIFILYLLQGTFCTGDDSDTISQKINTWIKHPNASCLENEIQNTATAMSKTLLTLKFIQGIPLVGSITGVYDAFYMHRLSTYAQIQYEKRKVYKNIEKDI